MNYFLLVTCNFCIWQQTESNPDCRDVMSICDNLLQTEEQLANVRIA